MVRIGLAGVVGFVLIYIESLIAMQLKGGAAIVFDGIPSFMSIWSMNFFLVFAMLTQFVQWFENREAIAKNEENNIF